MDQCPKCRNKNYRTLRRRKQVNFHDLGFGNGLSDMKPKAQANKDKQMDFIKMGNFCASKDMITKEKRKPARWEKIYANCVPGKCLVSRIDKEPF